MTPWFFSESIDYLKILGNPWINWFLNFPYDICILTFWLNGPWPLRFNQLCETFIGRKNSNGYFFFCFLTLKIFWVLRFLFPSFLRQKQDSKRIQNRSINSFLRHLRVKQVTCFCFVFYLIFVYCNCLLKPFQIYTECNLEVKNL